MTTCREVCNHVSPGTLYTNDSQRGYLQDDLKEEIRLNNKGRWYERPVTPSQHVFGPASPSHLLGMLGRTRQSFWLLKPSDVSMLLFFLSFHVCICVYWSATTESTVQMCKQIEGSRDHPEK